MRLGPVGQVGISGVTYSVVDELLTTTTNDAEAQGRFAGAEQWQVASQYLVWHLTQRGALWASGAAQAAQFVRIILRWRGL